MANPFSKDGWDWPFILYAGRVWLLYSDEEVWNLTPRKFHSLLMVHFDIVKMQHGDEGNARTNQSAGFIDEIPGW